MQYVINLLFPNLLTREGEHHQGGQMFTLYGCDLLQLREQLLKIREEVDKRIAIVECDLHYIKKTWDPNGKIS